jgi:hypothetical protein
VVDIEPNRYIESKRDTEIDGEIATERKQKHRQKPI